MSVIKVANIHFDSTGTSRIEWGGDNTVTIKAGAVRVPIGDTASRPSSPVPGLLRYNTTLGQLESYNASSWGPLTGSGSSFTVGTRWIFAQTSAPTGWTKDTTNYNNHTLRVVTGTAATGGTVDFTTAFASKAVSGSVSISGSSGTATISTPQLPSHVHYTPLVGPYLRPAAPTGAHWAGNDSYSVSSSAVGGGGSHSHPSGVTGSFTGTAINLAVRYLDVITATKN